jgi:uncharacterized protein YfaS (alpha-2-macroglobulin family)
VRIQASGVTPLAGAGGGPRWAVTKLADASFANAGTGALWRTVTVTGAPVSAPPPRASGLTLNKQVFGMHGEAVDPAALQQGDRVIVRVAATRCRAAAWPWWSTTRCRPVRDRDGARRRRRAERPFKFLGKLTAADAQEARDDRFVAATDLPGRETSPSPTSPAR